MQTIYFRFIRIYLQPSTQDYKLHSPKSLPEAEVIMQKWVPAQTPVHVADALKPVM